MKGVWDLMGANRKANKQINFRVTPAEYERLDKMAKRFGQSVPSFAKERTLKAKVKSPKIDRQGALKFASELRKIGNNVNQIARALNSGENANMDEIRAIKKELGQIWQQLNLAIQK